MYCIRKRMEISAAHQLKLTYESPCSRLHGHNWVVVVEVSSEELDENGMVIDFTHIKEVVKQLDHQNINKVVGFNPTAELIAKWIAVGVTRHLKEQHSAWVSKVVVQESEGNIAEWVPSNIL